MLDPRHPEDALFFVAESDYRFYEKDCIPNWYDVVLDETLPSLDKPGDIAEPFAGTEEAQPSPAPAEEGGAPTEEAASPQQEPKKRKFAGWTGAQRTKQAAHQVEISQELRDCVQICNRAAMIGRGHVVWFGWMAKSGKRKSVPSYASHLIAVSKEGAAAMLRSMETGHLEKGHWDIVVRNWLVKQNFQNPKVMGGCFVWPTVGSFQGHQSGCCPDVGFRGERWTDTCIQEGVRPFKPDHRHRWLACWPSDEKGGAEWLEQICFDSRDNVWITQLPPDRWWSTDSSWRRLLWNRWWIDDNLEWVGPTWAAEHKGAGKEKNKKKGETKSQSPAPDNKWALLVKRPDEYEWDYTLHKWAPITRLAEQVVVDWDNWKWDGNHTNREWNTRKKNIACYKRRVFQETPEEQVTIKKIVT